MTDTKKDAPPTVRIHSISFSCSPLPGGLGNVSNQAIDCTNPIERYAGWTISLRGSTVFLVSPRGWNHAEHRSKWDPKGEVAIYGIPLSQCLIRWQAGDPSIIDKLNRHDQLLERSVVEAEAA